MASIVKIFTDSVKEIKSALEQWNTRCDVSIKSEYETTYDRYDPARGLHNNPHEVEV